jgi:hypothetical protein
VSAARGSAHATTLGVIRLRIPRTRLRSFLPRCIRPLERASPEVAELIRQALLRGIIETIQRVSALGKRLRALLQIPHKHLCDILHSHRGYRLLDSRFVAGHNKPNTLSSFTREIRIPQGLGAHRKCRHADGYDSCRLVGAADRTVSRAYGICSATEDCCSIQL